MSGILGAFGGQILAVELEEPARALQRRGANLTRIGRPGTTLVLARHEWEATALTRGGSGVTTNGRVFVAADATLYYLGDLRRRLTTRGVTFGERASAGEAIVAAYTVHGEEAAAHLEGDFAYTLWDRERRRVVCARDFGGKRPLYYAIVRDTLVVASTIEAIATTPGFVRRLNLSVLAETCAQFWSSGSETCYVGVHELPAGATLVWTEGTEPRVFRHWRVPEIGTARRSCFEHDALALRELLVQAVQERMPEAGAAAIWLSGGWDSSAVFGAGQAVLRTSGRDAADLMPVSISYPEGDPGREDEMIAAIAKHWGARVQWLDVDAIPLLGREPEGWASRRDIPSAHTYEHWNRALAHASGDSGARVAFDGNGGDQLFQISDVFLSDLLRRGRWTQLVQQWRVKGGRGRGTFFDWVIAPSLPQPLRGPITRRLGRHSADDFTRTVPPWIRSDFAATHRLVERERRSLPRRRGYRGWRHEAHHFLAAPAFARAFQQLAGFALDAGVELRSPLYDRRVVEFACARPREERNSGTETKRLLRAAMAGLLPHEVLLPRPRRTGVTTAYSDRRMRQEFPVLLDRYADMTQLADLGIVEPKEVHASWDRYCRTGEVSIKIPLFLTMQVELWLRCHTRSMPYESAVPRPASLISAM